MFSDEAQEAVEFLSSWKTQRSVKDGFAQTSEIITYEANVQSVHKVNQEVQTEEDEDDKRKLIFVVEDEKPVRKLAPLLSFYFSILRHNVYVHRGTQCLEKLNLVSFAGSCKFHPQSVS